MISKHLTIVSDELSLDLEKVAGFLSENGYRNVELRFVWIKSIGYFDEMDVEAVKEILGEHDLKVSCISSQLFKTKWWGTRDEPVLMADGTWVKDAEMALARNAIKMAKEFGASYLRAFGFKKPRKEDGVDQDLVWEDWIESVRRISRMAADEGKTLVLENEHDSIFSDIASIRETIRDVNHPACKLLLDPGNLFTGGEILDEDNLHELVSHVGYVHVKDAIATSRNPWRRKWTLIGDGEVGWPLIIKTLLDDGFHSYFSVETHFGGKDERWNNSVENLRRLNRLLLEHEETG